MQVEGLEGVEIVRLDMGDGREDRLLVRPAQGFVFKYSPIFEGHEVLREIQPRTAVLKKTITTKAELDSVELQAVSEGFDLAFE